MTAFVVLLVKRGWRERDHGKGENFAAVIKKAIGATELFNPVFLFVFYEKCDII